MARGACLLFMSAVFLSGCLDPPAAVGGSKNSGVRSLKVGMSPSKVAGIIGTYQVEKTARPPGRILACRSYILDEQQLLVRFAHVLFCKKTCFRHRWRRDNLQHLRFGHGLRGALSGGPGCL